jgi:hypothetical protein
MITTEVTTICNFGSLEVEPIKNDFGFYQDNITICLKCMDDVPSVTKTYVDDVQYVKKTMADTSTKTNNSGYNAGGGIGLEGGIGLGGMLRAEAHGHGEANYVHRRGGSAAHGNIGEISFRQLDSFFVHDRGSNDKLQYNFLYPQNVLQEIASDWSDFKTENTFRPTIVGNWENLNENEKNKYIFHVKRHIISKANLRKSFKLVGDPPYIQKHFEVNFDKSTDTHEPISDTRGPIDDTRVTINDTNEDTTKVPPLTIQCYEVTLWVNHKMNELHHKVTTMSLSENNMTIPGVMGIEKRSTSHTT